MRPARPYLTRVEMLLARGPHFPTGSNLRGLVLLAPLDRSHHLDSTLWESCIEECLVRRFWAGLPDRIGLLVHTGIGDTSSWRLEFPTRTNLDDSFGSRLSQHRLAPGYLISFGDAEQELIYRVVSSRPAEVGEAP